LIINECIDSSDKDTIINFWIMRLGDVKFDDKDSRFTIYILQKLLDNKKLTDSQYISLINMLKKNWRRLLNVNIIDKFFLYLNSDNSNLYCQKEN